MKRPLLVTVSFFLIINIAFNMKCLAFLDSYEHDIQPKHGVCLRSTLSSLDGTELLPRRHSESVLFDIFLGSCDLGARIFLFTSNIELLRRSCFYHGLQYRTSHSVDELRNFLLQHLLHGECINQHARSQDSIACREIAAGFRLSIDLADFIFDMLTTADASSISLKNLWTIAQSICIDLDSATEHEHQRRKRAVSVLNVYRCRGSYESLSKSSQTFFSNAEQLSKSCLEGIASWHNLCFVGIKEELLDRIFDHISKGMCATYIHDRRYSCFHVFNENISEDKKRNCDTVDDSFGLCADTNQQVYELQIELLSSLRPVIAKNPLLRLLRCHEVEFDKHDSLSLLRRRLKNLLSVLMKENRSRAYGFRKHEEHMAMENERRRVALDWPCVVPESQKRLFIENFRQKTGSKALASFVCFACAGRYNLKEKQKMLFSDFDVTLLNRPDVRIHKGKVVDEQYFSTITEDYECFSTDFLRDIMYENEGMLLDCEEAGRPIGGYFCKGCFSAINRGKTPALALANHNFIGTLPSALQSLTIAEEMMIALCRAKCFIMHLKEELCDIPNAQRGMKGNVIVFPQRPSRVLDILPPPIEDVVTPICVLFVGSSPPSNEWLRKHAKPLIVRREKVRTALLWLCKHNILYSDVAIDHERLDLLSEEDVLPVYIETLCETADAEVAQNALTSRYDNVPSNSSVASPVDIFEHVVVTDVNGDTPSHELRVAALRHVKERSGAFVQVPHGLTPVNEYVNPELLPKIYPTLFPYGVGGFEHPRRTHALSFKRQIKHLFNLADRRFQEHYSFLFIVFNILQRRTSLLHTSLKVKRTSFGDVSANFASVSALAVHTVAERVANGDFSTVYTPEEEKVRRLLKEVNGVTSHVPGSGSARAVMRNEIRGLMFDKGLPNFYITINPADVYNPIVKVLAGSEIDIDAMGPDEIPQFWPQSILVARNPIVAAKFFDLYIRTFCSEMLGYNTKNCMVSEGILGRVKAYYGCVEAQGRGTLHCHMMVWLEGGHDPDEIKRRIIDRNDTDFRDRLMSFLDDVIHNDIPCDPDSSISVPSATHHPCSVRGVTLNSGLDDTQVNIARQKDLHHLVKACQVHKHNLTCFKYWKGPPHPRECRFDLDESHFCSESYIDNDTGEICLRCLDGMVNNFNASILEAVRCNMDIKFIGSGASAKAILYYITDYITKSQLKAHVAYAALDLARRKLSEFDSADDDLTVRAKELIRKSAHAMISHQELSSQQVAAYLLNFGDCYTSHEYRNVFWTSFENYVDALMPIEKHFNSSASCEKECLEMEEANIRNDEDDICEVNCLNPSDDEILQDIAGSALASDEVSLSINDEGHLTPKGNQVQDYYLRSPGLRDVCVWDFVAQIDKQKIRRSDRHNKNNADESNEFVEEVVGDDESAFDLDGPQHDDDAFPAVGKKKVESADCRTAMSHIMQIKSRSRPSFELCDDHVQSRTHLLVVRHPDRRYVPVPIGPSLPRRDRPEVWERYCRLMLILFKPWTVVNDLREPFIMWSDAFEAFIKDCSDNTLFIMKNMQILHECKDSRDDHFANRRQRSSNRSNRVCGEVLERTTITDDNIDYELNEDDIFRHMTSIDQISLTKRSQQRDIILSCLHHMEIAGRFSVSRCFTSTTVQDSSIGAVVEVNNNDLLLEDEWRHAYECRKASWKQRAIEHGHSDVASSLEPCVEDVAVNFGDEMRNAADLPSFSATPEISPAIVQQTNQPTSGNTVIDIPAMISEYGLNTEQARAFSLIANHSLKKNTEPLRMFLGGPGGTGKSRIIMAITDFFKRRGEERRFRLTSFMGVAARNIAGMTLHAALNLNQRMKKGSKGKSKRDLIAMWQAVDYLLIDEVSMISCNLLVQIHEALCEAKENSALFGGVNIVFAGDFAQLPPVGQRGLHRKINTYAVTTVKGQNAVFGRLLWLSITTVVLLKIVMRQTGDHNVQFLEVLSRLRVGTCTEEDYELLSSRIVSKVKPEWNDGGWLHAPVIVSTNEVKDVINVRATLTFAEYTKRPVHWYYCIDKHNGRKINSPELREHFYTLHSGATGHRLGKIPLVLGMPVMIGQNYDVSAGIVNGCIGSLKSIRYSEDDSGNRFATSCIVYTPSTSGESLPHLEEQESVVLPDTVELSFENPFNAKRCRIKRTQLPISPGFAMTTHKAQGQTMERAIIDFEGCTGSEAPYVMLSRVKSLDGLLILRPFNKKKISCRQSEDTRIEEKRQSVLAQQTLIDVTTDPAKRFQAQTELRNMLGTANIDNIKASAEMSDSSHEFVTRIVNKVRSVQTEIEKIGNTINRKRKYDESTCMADGTKERSNCFAIASRTPCKKKRLDSP